MGNLRAWLQASRLPSQTYIAFPILAGQMAAFAITGNWSWMGFFLAQLFGIFDQLYIVYANDWADVETDSANETFNMFSGGSRVVVDGMISRKALGIAAIFMATLSVVVGGLISLIQFSALPLAFSILGVLLLWGYSYPPLKLSYRGGGEFLQMLGVGGVLPLLGFMAQGGSFESFPLMLLAVSLPISLACGMATSIPDEPSDRSSEKRTASVILGAVPVQMPIIILAIFSIFLWIAAPMVLQPALALRLAAGALPLVLLTGSLFSYGGKAGSGKLNRFVTLLVASNVTFFLGISVVLLF